jgi:cell division protein FtsQ
MDDRIRDRRRSVRQGRGRRRAIPIIVLIILVAAGGTFLWLRSSSVFAVKTVTATATERITREDIAGATAPAVGVSLLRVSTGEVKKALAALPYVRSVEVYRDFPNTLEIELVEYEPLARVQASEGNVWLVSDDGRVLERVTPPRGYSLPLVIPAMSITLELGTQAPGEIIAALPVVRELLSGDVADKLPDVKQVDVNAAGEVGLTLADGSQLRLGTTDDLEQKLNAAVDAIERYVKDGKQWEYVDVSVPTRPAVKPK